MKVVPVFLYFYVVDELIQFIVSLYIRVITNRSGYDFIINFTSCVSFQHRLPGD